MPSLVGIRFYRSDRVHYFNSGELELAIGDTIEVETEDGIREGKVAIAPNQVLHSDLRGPLDSVLRKSEDSA